MNSSKKTNLDPQTRVKMNKLQQKVAPAVNPNAFARYVKRNPQVGYSKDINDLHKRSQDLNSNLNGRNSRVNRMNVFSKVYENVDEYINALIDESPTINVKQLSENLKSENLNVNDYENDFLRSLYDPNHLKETMITSPMSMGTGSNSNTIISVPKSPTESGCSVCKRKKKR